MTDRSTPRSNGAESGVRLRRAVPEFTGWALIAVGVLLAIIATAVGTGGIGAAALLAAGVALIIVARFDGLFGRVRDLLDDTVLSSRAAGMQPPRAASTVPHHRATRALLGETVSALNAADPSAPWTIERDGSWSTAQVFDYAIYRRHEGAPPERVAVEVDPTPASDMAATALRIASSFGAGGGLYDAILIVAADLDHATADRLERLVSRMCGAPCVAVAVQGVAGPAGTDDGGAEILLLAEALEHVTSAQRASAPRATAAPAPSRPAPERVVAPATPPAEPERREPAAWRMPEAAPTAPEPRTAAPQPRTPAPEPAASEAAAADDFAALLQQAATEPPPSRRSRSQR
ncbi:hypothetical protein P0L94_15245 [Microbacter sp. GSS18]|nr:hypothetical protein P0L94_15245 [Microbacter sp. GSS18]